MGSVRFWGTSFLPQLLCWLCRDVGGRVLVVVGLGCGEDVCCRVVRQTLPPGSGFKPHYLQHHSHWG